jgi:cytochrome c oxidase cbb3-type subunit III
MESSFEGGAQAAVPDFLSRTTLPRTHFLSERRINLPKKFSSVMLFALLIFCGHHSFQSGLQAQGRKPGNLRSYDRQSVEAGQKLFSQTCSVCHGIDGKGSGRGPDLTQGLVVTRGTDDDVFQVIHKGVPGSAMPGFDLPDSQIRQLVAFIRSLSTKAAELFVPGDQGTGKEVFLGKGGCSQCHMIRGQGSLVGPDLSNLGGEHTLSEIRESILKPNESVQRRYKSITVVTQSGERITGTLRNRDNFSLQMMDPQGNFRFFLTRELREIIPQERSLMPDHYGTLLSAEELQNLLAYLSRQTVNPVVEK